MSAQGEQISGAGQPSGRVVAAVDLGAESGRVLAYGFDGERLTLLASRRFPNGARESQGFLRWDFEALWTAVRDGLAEIGAQLGRIDSVGVDSWGVDYGLLDANGDLREDPVAYRDSRTSGLLQQAGEAVGLERIYDETGIQLMEFNTIFQLYADARANRFNGADRLLLIPDLFHYRLSGVAVSETTIASTTGCYDVRRKAWTTDLLAELGVPAEILPEVVAPGTDLGPLSTALRGGPFDGPAFAGTRVVLPGSHDTASAVAGVPFVDPHAAYISSGTWSLVGLETPSPVVTVATRLANLTNEGGVGGTNRLLRNVMGLWLLQECRRQWQREGTDLSYTELVALAESAFTSTVINPDEPGFLAPGDMVDRIREQARRTGQPEPVTVGDVARCVLISLADRYRRTLDDLIAASGRDIPAIHIVGGGANNHLLDQLTAKATGRPVYAGPTEATALGNAVVQLIALGELADLGEAREVLRTTEKPQVFQPSA